MKELVTTTLLVQKGYDYHKEVSIDGYIDYHVETAYGADADGNRGEKRIFVDDVLEVQAYDDDGDEVELNDEHMEEAVNLLTRKFLEGK